MIVAKKSVILSLKEKAGSLKESLQTRLNIIKVVFIVVIVLLLLMVVMSLLVVVFV